MSAFSSVSLSCYIPHTFFFLSFLSSSLRATSLLQFSHPIPVMFHMSFFLVAAFAATVLSYPNRGHYPFAIALCKHSDRNQEDITKARISEFFTSAGSSKPGMYQYLREMSSGAVDLEGSFLGGWYTTAKTYAQTAAVDRQTRLNICRDAAIAGGIVIPSVCLFFPFALFLPVYFLGLNTTTQTHKFMALYNTSPDFGAVAGPNGGVVLIANTDLAISISAHEVLHTLGSPHSRLSSQTAPRMYLFSR